MYKIHDISHMEKKESQFFLLHSICLNIKEKRERVQLLGGERKKNEGM